MVLPANTHTHTLWPYILVADCYSPSFRPLWHKKENTIWWSAAQTIYKASCNGCLEAKCNRAAEFHLFRKLGKHYVVLPEYFLKRRGYVTFTPVTYLSRFMRVNAANMKWHNGDIYPLPHDDFFKYLSKKKDEALNCGRNYGLRLTLDSERSTDSPAQSVKKNLTLTKLTVIKAH